MMNVYPAIPATSVEQARRQADLAAQAGADNVIIVGAIPVDTDHVTEQAFNAVTDDLPDIRVGINYNEITTSPYSAYSRTRDSVDNGQLATMPDALLVNYTPLLDEQSRIGGLRSLDNLRLSDQRLRAVTFFGLVATQYTPESDEAGVHSRALACDTRGLIDVVTTNGSDDNPYTLTKLDSIRSGLDHGVLLPVEDMRPPIPMAVVGKFGPESLETYAKLVGSIILEASPAICSDPGMFDRDKLREFITTAHQL